MADRICETTWHQEVPLKKYERCPVCGSTAVHLVTKGGEK